MAKLIESVSRGVPKALTEIITLGRTLKNRAADILAYYLSTAAHWGITRFQAPAPPLQRRRPVDPRRPHPAHDCRLTRKIIKYLNSYARTLLR